MDWSLSVPTVELPEIGLPDFSPSLIPEEARPLVLAPIYLVKIFIRGLVYAVLTVTVICGFIFGTIPLQFGLDWKILLVSLIAFGYVFALVHKKGHELNGKLDLLERLAAGELAAALAVAQELAEASASSTAKTLGAVMSFDAGAAIADGADGLSGAGVAVAQGAQEALGTAAGGARNVAQGTVDGAGAALGGAHDFIVSAFMNPLEAADGVVSGAMDAAGGALDGAGGTLKGVQGMASVTVAAAMELNPLYAFEKMIKLVLKVVLALVLLTPPALWIGGWVLWKFGIHINGAGLMALGLAFGTVGPLLWFVVRKRALYQLKHAETAVIEMKFEAAQNNSASHADESTPLVGSRIPQVHFTDTQFLAWGGVPEDRDESPV